MLFVHDIFAQVRIVFFGSNKYASTVIIILSHLYTTVINSFHYDL